MIEQEMYKFLSSLINNKDEVKVLQLLSETDYKDQTGAIGFEEILEKFMDYLGKMEGDR